MALAEIAAGLSIASSIGGVIGGLGSNKDAKKAIREQASLTYSNRMEEIRRQRRENAIITGENRARIGASNVQFTGSPMDYLRSVQSEMARDIAWRRQAAKREREAILAGAPGGAADFATIARGVSGIGQTLLGYHGRT